MASYLKNNPLAQSPDYLATVLDAVADPVIIQDAKRQVVFANQAAAHLLPAAGESDATNLCHKILFGLDAPCDEHGLPCPLKLVLARQEPVSVIRSQRSSDGQERWLEIKGHPVFDDGGQVVQVVETFHDITKNKEMANALMRYSRSQEDFFLASRKIATARDLKSLYHHIVSHAKELLQFDFSTLLLISDDKKALVVHDTIGFSASIINSLTLMEGQGLASYVAQTKMPGTVEDFSSESRFEVPQTVHEHNIRSALCVPMIVAGQVLGVLVGHTHAQRVFSDQEIILYDNLANQAAMALHSAHTLQELRASEDRYHDLFENSLDIIQMIGQDGRILYVNRAWKEALGYSEEEIPQLSAFDIIHPDSRPHCQDLFGRLCRGEKLELMETTFVSKDGRSFPVEGHINSKVVRGKLVSTRGIFRDITERKLFEEKLRELSSTDELTGLLNRRGFFAMAEKQMAISARSGTKLYLLYGDLDNMKWINDHKGHKVGDEALKETAELLRTTFRDGDILARVGGDEFTIMLTAIGNEHNEQQVLQRFHANLEKLNAQKGRLYELLISTGIARYDGASPCSIEELMSRADKRMYDNKRQRKAARAASGQATP